VVEYGAWLRVVLTAAAVALLLTLAGIYSIMAFTVSRRTREIGVRVALGALPHQVAGAVFFRAVIHVAYGVVAGSLLFPLLAYAISLVTTPAPSWPPLLQGVALLTGYMALMMGVCLLACVVPLHRALRIEPTEALAAEG
jgi:ABC-type antimicrobial peptide transport system permease subunit